ncbi:MAG: universal stress protein [Acidobacteriota bacterium]
MKREMKILIGYDGSESGKAMLRDLHRAGLPSQLEAHIITVADIWIPPAQWDDESIHPELAEGIAKKARQRVIHYLEEAQALATEAGNQLQTDFPSWLVKAQACAGSPAWEIIKIADEWKPDLIIVGSHGRSALGRLWFGSVSQKIVAQAHCPVRVARGRNESADLPIKIIIGVDGSPDADLAVHTVANRQWPAQTEVRLVTCIGAALSLPADNQLSDKLVESANYIKTHLEKCEKELSVIGLNVSTVIRKDDPKYALLNEAETLNADTIYIGSRGLGAFQRFLLGSVSTAVVSRAHCSVEVVRKGSE